MYHIWVVVFAIFWAVAEFPEPALLLDLGHGYQLAGATQILNGEHPFVDFKDVYGPFVYYVSAIAQGITGGRVIGELLLVALAYSLTYLLLYRLMLGLELAPLIALPATRIA